MSDSDTGSMQPFMDFVPALRLADAAVARAFDVQRALRRLLDADPATRATPVWREAASGLLDVAMRLQERVQTRQRERVILAADVLRELLKWRWIDMAEFERQRAILAEEVLPAVPGRDHPRFAVLRTVLAAGTDPAALEATLGDEAIDLNTHDYEKIFCIPANRTAEALAVLDRRDTVPAAIMARALRAIADSRGIAMPAPPPSGEAPRCTPATTVGELHFLSLPFRPPSSLPTGSGGRIAVCMAGQFRGGERALANWRREALDGIEHDVFIATWRRRGSRSLQGSCFPDRFLPSAAARVLEAAERRQGFPAVRDAYPSLIARIGTLGDETLSEEGLSRLDGVRGLRIFDEADPRFSAMPAQEKMHFLSREAVTMALAAPVPYRAVLRLRPDIEHLGRQGDAPVLRRALDGLEERLIHADAGYFMDPHCGFAVADRVTLGTPGAMEDVISIADHRARLRLHSLGFEGYLHGHRALAYHLLGLGFLVRPLGLEHGGFLEARLIAPDEARELVAADAAGRMDALDTALLAALAEDARAAATMKPPSP